MFIRPVSLHEVRTQNNIANFFLFFFGGLFYDDFSATKLYSVEPPSSYTVVFDTTTINCKN
jgi:hypothetical protein